MKRRKRCFTLFCTLALSVFLALAAAGPSPAESMKLGIYVYENLEGDHTFSSTFGTHLGSKLLSVCKNIAVEDNVPLQTNETIRILDEQTKDRKVVWTTLDAYAAGGEVKYPSVTFADNDIKFMDLTWKVNTDKAVSAARQAGLTHCLIGTCSGFVTPPNPGTAAGKRGLTVVTASVNVRLYNLNTGEAEWMRNYRQVVSHMDHRVAFEQGVEMVAERIAEDLSVFVGDTYGQ